MNTAKKITFLCCVLLLLLISYSIGSAASISRTVNYHAKTGLFDPIDKNFSFPDDFEEFYVNLNFFLSSGTTEIDLTGEVIFDQKNGTITIRGADGNFGTDGGIKFTGTIEMDFIMPLEFYHLFFGIPHPGLIIADLIFDLPDIDIPIKGSVEVFDFGKVWEDNNSFESLLLNGEYVNVRAGIRDIFSKRFNAEDLAAIIVIGVTKIPPVLVARAKKIIQAGLGSSGIRLNAGLTSDLTLSCKTLTINGEQITQELQSISAPRLDLTQSNYSVNTKYVGDLGRALDLLLSADVELDFNPLGITVWTYDKPIAELPINLIPQFHTDIVFDSYPATTSFPIAGQAPAVQSPKAVMGSQDTVRLTENGNPRQVNVAQYFSSKNALRYRVTSHNTSIARTNPSGWQSDSLFTIQPRNAGSTTLVITAEDPTSGLTATRTIALTVKGTLPDYTDISQPITGIGEQPIKPLYHGAEVVLILEGSPYVRYIRDNPGLNSNIVGEAKNRATGIITDGPELKNGHTWYEVEWHDLVEWQDLPKWNDPWWIAIYRDGTQILVHNPPDLEIYDFDVDDSTVKPGEMLTLEAEIENNGPGDSERTRIFFYYSTKHHADLTALYDSMIEEKLKFANIDGSAAVEVPSIREGRSKTIKITVDAPLTPHIDYYYGAIVTPEPIAVTEIQALNNFTTRNRPSRAQEENVEITSDPDFVVASISADKVTVDPGGTFELEATVRNQGLGTPRDNPRLDYYLSSNETITDKDTKVGSNSVSELNTGEIEDASIRLTAPTTPGVYYYGACVDLRYESKTDNNCSPVVAITVQDSAPSQEPDPPDLIVKPFSVNATTVNPGEPFTLNATVTNQGNGHADAITLRYYRSSNTRISPSDAEVGSIDINSLNTQESEKRNLSLTAPLASGTYHYGACVDGLPTENDTQNNCSAGVAITVKNLAPGATDTSLPTPTLLANGTSVTIDLHPYFSDPNGDDISYQAWTDNTDIVAVHLFGGSESLLTINPLGEAGIATVVVEAKDAQSLDWSARQDITVTVTAPSLIAGVCDRTPQIRDTLTRISSLADCANITSVHLDALTTLVLAGEGITTLKVDDFDGLSNLTVLNLSENLLAGLDTSVLNPLMNLRQLDASRNRLTFLDETTFNAHLGLETLDLSNNQLAYISPGIFGDLANLTKLNLAGNHLIQLPPGIFVGLRSLTELDVRGNPNALFILSPTPVRTDTPDNAAVGPATITVYLAQGAPFDIDVSLAAEDGTLSKTTATIARGDTYSQPITVTPTGKGAVTVVPSVSGIPPAYYGFQLSSGNPLVLFDVGANQAPVPVAHIPAKMLHTGGTAATLDLSSYFSDVDNDTLTYTGTSSNQNVATLDVSDDVLTITPQLVGIAILSITANDGDLTATQTLTVIVSSEAPISIPDPNLAAAVRNELNLGANDAITQADMLKLTFLSINRSGNISNLAGLEYATNLKFLNIWNNKVNDLSPLKDLTNLTYLGFVSNNISDVTSLKGLTNLTSLELGNNHISDVAPLRDLINLTYLRLHANDISDVAPLKDLTNLMGLSLGDNNISDVAPLKDLTNLTWLPLYSNKISDVSPLATLINLTELDLSSNEVTDISTLAVLKNLNRLYLNNNQVAALPIGFFAGFSNLSTLTLTGNPGAPFTFTLELVRTDTTDLKTPGPATVKVKVAEGAPFDMSVTLSGSDGTLSATTATIAKGSAESEVITVIQTGNGATTVRLGTPPEIPASRFSGEGNYEGIQTTVGDPLVLFGVGAAPSTVAAEQPNTTALLSNFPNPFNPETWIPYQLVTPTDVTLTIYTMQGVLVRRLELGHQPAGFYQRRSRAAYWDGKNKLGEPVASGVYFYTLTAGEFSATRKMLIRK